MTVADAPEALLEVREVGKAYRRGSEAVHALRSVSFSLSSAEVVVLNGPSGSGKTTLLNLLAAWEAPDEGEVVWTIPPAAPTSPSWEDVAVIPQGLGLVEELSIRENVELPLRLAPGSAAPDGDGSRWGRVEALLAELGLDDLADRLPAEASLGEQQRTALARALVASPRLLLADEPTGHQDAGWSRVVLRSLREAAGAGTCCLLATHNREAVRFASRTLSIRDGEVSVRAKGGKGAEDGQPAPARSRKRVAARMGVPVGGQRARTRTTKATTVGKGRGKRD